jgi:hypothetical protein
VAQNQHGVPKILRLTTRLRASKLLLNAHASAIYIADAIQEITSENQKHCHDYKMYVYNPCRVPYHTQDPSA